LQFWAERAEKVFPGHDVIFHLKVTNHIPCLSDCQLQLYIVCNYTEIQNLQYKVLLLILTEDFETQREMKFRLANFAVMNMNARKKNRSHKHWRKFYHLFIFFYRT